MPKKRQLDPCTLSNENSTQYKFDIDNYYGDPENLAWFSSQIRELKELNAWSEDAALFYLKTKLKGSAQTFFASSPSCQNLETLDEALSMLKNFFGQQASSSISINKFNSITLLPQESMRSLAHRIESAAHQAYHFINDEQALNKIKSIQFINAIPQQVRTNLIFDNPSNFNKIVQKAVAFEDFSKSQCSDKVNAVQCIPKKESSDDFEKLREQMSTLTMAVTTALSQCAFCGDTSHKLKNCREFLEISRGNQSQGHNVVKCQFCNRVGHPMSRCRLYNGTRMTNNQGRNVRNFDSNNTDTRNRGRGENNSQALN